MWCFILDRVPQNSGLCPNIFKGRRCHSTSELSFNVIGMIIVWIALRYSSAQLHSPKEKQAGEWLGVTVRFLIFFLLDWRKRVCNISFWRTICSPYLTATQPRDSIMQTWPVGPFLFTDTTLVFTLIPDCNPRGPKVAIEQDVIVPYFPAWSCGDKWAL